MVYKFKYYINVIKNASFEKLSKEIKIAHERSQKSKIYIFLDMVYSYMRYGAGYYDYVIFEFWNLNHYQRNTYLTRFRSKKFVTFMNDHSYAHFFDNKNEFYERFKSYIGREFLDLEIVNKEIVSDFFYKHDRYFAKMKDLSCGIGAELLFKEKFHDFDDFYTYIKQKNFTTIEDVLENHPDLQKLYPFSLNTVRIITIIDDNGTPHCIFAVLKMGYNNRIVDNLGLHGPLDLKTGEFLYPAHSGDTSKGNHYTEHPYSHIPLIGYKVPLLHEAIDLALKAALEIPQMRYIGWDIAITPNGPVIIEGNNYCAHDFWQLPGQTSDGIGILPIINKIIPEFKY